MPTLCIALNLFFLLHPYLCQLVESTSTSPEVGLHVIMTVNPSVGSKLSAFNYGLGLVHGSLVDLVRVVTVSRGPQQSASFLGSDGNVE